MWHKLHHTGGIRLRDILPEANFFGGEIRVSSCARDSRNCQPGDLFAALVGSREDGHAFAEEAVRRGAAAILAERMLPVAVPMCMVEDSRDAYGRVCQALAGEPGRQMRVLGVTGTYGKTTTSMLVAAILEAAGESTGLFTSLGYCDGDRLTTDVPATPAPEELAAWLAQMVRSGCRHTVLEASSQGLAERRLAGVPLDVAVLTNVRRAHLDLHGTVFNYRQAKQRIFDHLKPEGVAILNADDPATRFVLDQLSHPVLTVGMHAQAEITAQVLERSLAEQTFLICVGADAIAVRTRIVSNSYIYHCLSAAAVGLVLGIDLPTIVRGIETLETLPGRWERIECGQPFGVVVDQAYTADSLAATLKSLRQVTNKRLICVYGGRGGCLHDERPLLGRAVERYADVGIITNTNPGDEEPFQIAHDILDGYDRPAQAQLMPDRLRAIAWALSEARSGDTVLIAGRGNEALHVVGQRCEELDDREVARELLYEMGASANVLSGSFAGL